MSQKDLKIRIVGEASLYRGASQSLWEDLNLGRPIDWSRSLPCNPKSPWDPVSQLAIPIARTALGQKSSVCLGVVVGSSRGPVQLHEKLYQDYLANRRIPSWTSPATTFSSLSSSIAKALCANGPSFTLSSACSTSLQTVGTAFSLIRSGLADTIVAGGAEAAPSGFTKAAFQATGACSRPLPDSTQWPCQPGSRQRNGMYPSEGASFVTLQVSQADQGIFVSGFGSTTEQSGRTGVDPQGRGLARAVDQALDIANIAAKDIDAIVGHGTGTIKGDSAEIHAYESLFEDLPPLRFLKWLTGHTLGAAGCLGLHQGIEILRRSTLPDMPYEDLIHKSLKARMTSAPRHVLVTAMGFGGSAAAIVLSRE